jgi:hypothetical protein
VACARRRKLAASTVTARQKNLKEALEEAGFSVKFFAARSQEAETERRTGLKGGDERGREVLVSLGHGHQHERAPAHAEKILVNAGAVREGIHFGCDCVAEVEQLKRKPVEGPASTDRARE